MKVRWRASPGDGRRLAGFVFEAGFWYNGNDLQRSDANAGQSALLAHRPIDPLTDAASARLAARGDD